MTVRQAGAKFAAAEAHAAYAGLGADMHGGHEMAGMAGPGTTGIAAMAVLSFLVLAVGVVVAGVLGSLTMME